MKVSKLLYKKLESLTIYIELLNIKHFSTVLGCRYIVVYYCILWYNMRYNVSEAA